jgi:hypothetical protein
MVIPRLVPEEVDSPGDHVMNVARAEPSRELGSGAAGVAALRRNGRANPTSQSIRERQNRHTATLAEAAPPTASADIVHSLPLQLSPVMFSEEDRRAFARFVAAVSDGRVPDRVVGTVGEDEMAPLAIAPLVIAPLKPLARAAKEEGEGQWE